MKLLAICIVLAVVITACGPGSSPEGRMTVKLTELKQQMDSLKTQNAEIKDSLRKVSQEISLLKNSK